FDPAKLNIRANTSPESVGSVVFELDGKKFRTENVSPYALAGDNPPGNYHDWTPPLGEHILKATPYTEKNGGGETGPSLTIRFTVVEEQIPNVQSFTLVNADTDQDIGWLSDGDVIRLGSLPSTQLNIRANTSPKEVGSVVFEL